jgi:hypothetical protein
VTISFVMSVCLSVSLSVCLSLCLSVSLSVSVSLCLSVCLSVYMEKLAPISQICVKMIKGNNSQVQTVKYLMKKTLFTF